MKKVRPAWLRVHDKCRELARIQGRKYTSRFKRRFKK